MGLPFGRVDAHRSLTHKVQKLQAEKCSVLRSLAEAGEDGSVSPGSEVIEVASNPPEDKKPLKLQRLHPIPH